LAGFVVFALVTLLCTVVLANTIANRVGGDTTEYAAKFTDVTGVNRGDDVRVAGVRVGEVDSVGLVDRKVALVRFSVRSSLRLPVTTRALIRYRNLIGQRYLSLEQGVAEGATAPGATLAAGATLPLSQTRPAVNLTQLFNGFKPLFAALSPGDVNQLASEIIQVFQGEGGTMTTLLTQTAQLTGNLADRDQLIGSVVDNLDRLLGTLDRRSSQFDGLLTQLQRLVGGLAQDRQAVGDSLGGIDSLASATAGLTQQARPDLRADLSQLNTLAGALAANDGQFQQTVRQLPGRAQSLIGAASYGSWFNFYLCDLRGAVTLPTLGQVRIPALRYTTARCPQ
jgi:phospholipid/cholesterol/gamma-HCH transport system substrate-binding protein